MTELPLFVLGADYDHQGGVAALAAQFRHRLPLLMEQAHVGDGLDDAVREFGIRTLDVETAVRLHLRVLDLALRTAAGGTPEASGA